MTGHVEEAAPLETSGLGLTDPTTLKGAVLREEGDSVEVGAVGAANTAVVTGVATETQARMIKVLRKATWEATITTIPAHPKGSTTRTATTTTLLGRNSTIQIRLAVTIWVMAMKVRWRVPFEFLRSDERV